MTTIKNLRSRRNSTSGFTLIEMLVALSIVVSITALSLPVFSSSRTYVRAVNCNAKMRDQFIAMDVYASHETREMRYPPLTFDNTIIKAPKVTACDNMIQTSAGYTPPPPSQLSNYADILINASYEMRKVFSCPGDESIGNGCTDPAYQDEIQYAKLSYGLNWYLYDRHVGDFGGGERWGPWTTGDTKSIGSNGDKGPGYYGPLRDQNSATRGIVDPSATIFIGDRNPANLGVGVGYTYYQYMLEMNRHGSHISLGWMDGHGTTLSYEKLWGPFGGKYNPSLNIIQHMDKDFWSDPTLRRNRLNAGNKPLTWGVTGQATNYNNVSYSTGHAKFRKDWNTKTWNVECVIMPYWQGFEAQPFFWN